MLSMLYENKDDYMSNHEICGNKCLGVLDSLKVLPEETRQKCPKCGSMAAVLVTGCNTVTPVCYACYVGKMKVKP